MICGERLQCEGTCGIRVCGTDPKASAGSNHVICGVWLLNIKYLILKVSKTLFKKESLRWAKVLTLLCEQDLRKCMYKAIANYMHYDARLCKTRHKYGCLYRSILELSKMSQKYANTHTHTHTINHKYFNISKKKCKNVQTVHKECTRR